MSGPVVVVLAAGRGQRFQDAGGQGRKLDALLAGKRVLDRTLDAVHASGLSVYLVDTPTNGMGHSIAAGVLANPEAEGWLILPGDMPLVSPATIRRVATALGEAAVAVPCHGGRRGHPVGFATQCRDHLLALTGDEGARAVVARFPLHELAVDDPGCVFDIDTPVDLDRAGRRL